MRRVGKGCSGVESPLFENMLQVREVDAKDEVQVPAHDDVDQENVIEEIADVVAQPTSPLPSSPVIPSSPPYQSPRTSPSQAAEGTSILVQQVLDKCSALVLRVEGLESANTAQQLEILKLKARVKKLERLNKVKSSKLKRLKKVGTSQRIESSEDEENVFNQGRISVDIDEGIELVDDQEKDAQVKGRQADTQAEIYNIDLDHNSKVLSMQEDTEVQEVVEVVNAAKLMTEEEEESHAQAKDVQPKDAPAKGIQKVPVVNYEIVMISNKPREDLEDLWKITKARFSTSKPTNFTDDYLLVTLKNMFEKTDAQDVIWRSQHTKHRQALLKIKLVEQRRNSMFDYVNIKFKGGLLG
nr:hypothetical protein [Tanacetum cinerariifolium]